MKALRDILFLSLYTSSKLSSDKNSRMRKRLTAVFDLVESSFANFVCYAGFPLGEFVRANRERGNFIGWCQTLTTSPANHIRFLLVRENRLYSVYVLRSMSPAWSRARLCKIFRFQESHFLEFRNFQRTEHFHFGSICCNTYMLSQLWK